ncbi:MAG: HAD-IB family phosphatase [Chloroflexota bacterium]
MRWPPYQHIFFDCDSTLTAVEGIDALADALGKGWRIKVLTEAAMNGEVDLEEVYARRLRALKPTRAQIQAIRQTYKQNVVEDAAGVIAALQHLGHQVYIISGGLAEPVEEFGVFLGVPRQHIRAVGVQYNQLAGDWWRNQDSEYPNSDQRYLTFDQGWLTVSDGKAQIVGELLGEQSGRSLLIGDGRSDLLAARAVDLFVGFGGVVERPAVLAQAPVTIHSPTLSPLLALAAGPAGLRRLHHTSYQPLVDKSLHLISTGAMTFQDERLNQKFHQAYQAVHSRPH